MESKFVIVPVEAAIVGRQGQEKGDSAVFQHHEQTPPSGERRSLQEEPYNNYRVKQNRQFVEKHRPGMQQCCKEWPAKASGK